MSVAQYYRAIREREQKRSAFGHDGLPIGDRKIVDLNTAPSHYQVAGTRR